METQLSEARVLLNTALESYLDAGYDVLKQMIGHNDSLETQGPSGNHYQLNCYVTQVSPADRMLTVLGIAIQNGLPEQMMRETSLAFSVLSDDTVF